MIYEKMYCKLEKDINCFALRGRGEQRRSECKECFNAASWFISLSDKPISKERE
jgi:hypothetical protein